LSEEDRKIEKMLEQEKIKQNEEKLTIRVVFNGKKKTPGDKNMKKQQSQKIYKKKLMNRFDQRTRPNLLDEGKLPSLSLNKSPFFH
jgi:uncharacterized protein HemY